MRGSSSTAEMVLAMRASEALLPPERRVYDDRLAPHFLGSAALRALLRAPRLGRAIAALADRVYPGFMSEALLRARYFEQVVEAAARGGVSQLVLLGAGYDSTALRLGPELGLRAFELDEPATQRRKRQIVTRLGRDGALPDADGVRFVPCDFARDRLVDRLLEGGFDPRTPAVVGWLGVTMYLPAAAIDATLAQLREVCAPGSSLVVDYLDRAVLDGTGTSVGGRRGAKLVAVTGEPYAFGLAPAEAPAWIARYGFDAVEHLDGAQLARRFAPGRGRGRRPADFLGLLHAVRRRDGR